MKPHGYKLQDSVWLQPIIGCVSAFVIFFILPHNGLTFFFDLLLPLLLLPWMIVVIRNLVERHQYVKVIIVAVADMLSIAIFGLLPVIMFGFLPIIEPDPVMDEEDSKKFDIYLASYSCSENVVLDSIILNPKIWTQYRNRYTDYQNKEEIIVNPNFICYSCRIDKDAHYHKLLQMGYDLDWSLRYRNDSKGNSYTFAEYGVKTIDVKDTIVLHICKKGCHNDYVDSLTFVRTSELNVPAWDINQESVTRHVNRTWKQKFMDRIYYDYFWSSF